MNNSDPKVDEFSQAKSKDQIEFAQSGKKKDEQRSYGIFKSLRRYPKFINFASMFALALVAISGVAGTMYLRNIDDSVEDTSVSSEIEECSQTQVKIITSIGSYCRDCNFGEYGTLEFCEENTGGICIKNDRTKCYSGL